MWKPSVLLAWRSKGTARSAGFSLLELLVVISIIGILIAISTAAFSTAQQKSRDAKRRGDVKAMQNGFEQYYSQNEGSYATANCQDMVAINGVPIFTGGLPVDPKSGGAYTCTTVNDVYCICATLETKNGNASTADCSTIGPPVSTYAYYCASNLQ